MTANSTAANNAAQEVSISVIRNFTIEAIAPFLTRELAAAGLGAKLQFGGFATAAQEVARGDLAMEGGSADITVLALGLEEAAQNFGRMDWPAEDVCEHILALAQKAAETWGSAICINTVLPPLLQPWGLARGNESALAENAIATLNIRLRDIAARAPGRVVLCDWERYARLLGERGTYDYRFWYSSRAPFAAPFLKMYAADIAKAIRIIKGRIYKCLVLDCDNTLWGGIVGEDGLDGIQLSSDAVPGRYFHEFQRTALDLAKRGVILALCSKNNEADVMEVLDKHPDCLIRRKDLAGWKISWATKSELLMSLANELRIGLDSMVFVDDNPFECELVGQALPQIKVLQIPERREELASLLLRSDVFGTLAVTEMDRVRSKDYQVQRERRDLHHTARNLDDYFRLLETRAVLRPALDVDVGRVTQLFQRTNQFNLTTRRYDEAAVRQAIASDDKLLLVSEIFDRFGAMGLSGILLARRDGDTVTIDSMLLSCRVLGREIEFALVGAAADYLRSLWRFNYLVAEFVPSAKNNQCADFWECCGMERMKPDPNGPDGTARFRTDNIAEVIRRTQRPFVSIEVRM